MYYLSNEQGRPAIIIPMLLYSDYSKNCQDALLPASALNQVWEELMWFLSNQCLAERSVFCFAECQENTPMLTRRQAIKNALIAAMTAYTAARGQAAATTTPTTAPTLAIPPAASPTPQAAAPTGPFTLPPLPYSYDALEPYVDTQTMHLHHDKHHQTYVNNLNKAVADYPDLQTKSVEELLRRLDTLPEKIRTAVRNNGGGHYNHSLWWPMLKKGGGAPTGDLADAINKKFGSYAGFQEQFTKEALGIFGSGWAWLSQDPTGALLIEHTPNQDSPISLGHIPLLGIDVWEHAYYLKYQNKRADYITAFYNIINWDTVAKRYKTPTT
jgi:Fe-Mn family superoxide dismutase